MLDLTGPRSRPGGWRSWVLFWRPWARPRRRQPRLEVEALDDRTLPSLVSVGPPGTPLGDAGSSGQVQGVSPNAFPTLASQAIQGADLVVLDLGGAEWPLPSGQPQPLGSAPRYDLQITLNGAAPLSVAVQEVSPGGERTPVSTDPANRILLLLGPGCGGATAQSGNQPPLALVSVHFGGADQEFVSDLNTHLTEKLLRGGQDRPRPWEARFLDQSASQAPAFGPPPAPPFRRGPSTDGERDAGPGASSGPATPFPTGRQEDGPTGAEEAVFPAPLGPPGLPPDRPGAARERAEAGERPVAPPAGVDLLPLEDRSLTVLAVFLARSRAAGPPGGGSPRGEEPPLSPFVVGLTPAPREGPAPQPNPDPTGAESAGQADWRVELDPPTEGGTPVPGWPRLLACLTGRRLAAPLLQGACLFGLWQARRWLRRKRPPMPPEGPVGPARRNRPDSLGPECR